MTLKPIKQRQQAVAIARDVIAQIKARRYIAKRGVYVADVKETKSGFKAKPEHGNPFGTGDLQQLLKRHRKPCGVCALGSAFLSTVRLYNDFTIDPTTVYNSSTFQYEEGAPEVIDNTQMREKLQGFFTPLEMGWIEATFEGAKGFLEYDRVNEKSTMSYSQAEEQFKVSGLERLRRALNDEDRLIWIMRQIIKDDGHFIPLNASRAADRLLARSRA